MTDHIFDILGIGSREDSYTDLIAYAFTHNSGFRRNLLTLLQEQEQDGWESLVRLPVPIKSETGRKKDVPDLILFSRKLNKIILIENKVFSEEGWKQTERYASNEFKKSLEDYFKVTNPDFKFFFLTLDGRKPYSPLFQTISYEDISKCIPKDLDSSKLDILLKELKERIDEYYNWPLPNENDTVLNYLKNTKRLVSSFRTFTIVANNLFDSSFDFLEDCGITANRGSGYIPLFLWYKKAWRSMEYPEEQDGSKCYDIHFEFQWDTREDRENLTLYLHYHTNPYMTQSELKQLPKDFIEKYKKTRDKFFNFVKENAPKDWNISKTVLRIAYYSFDKSITFGELKRKANELVSNMILIIDDFLRAL